MQRTPKDSNSAHILGQPKESKGFQKYSNYSSPQLNKGSQKILMDFNGSQWIPKDSKGFHITQKDSKGLKRIPKILQNILRTSKIFQRNSIFSQN